MALKVNDDAHVAKSTDAVKGPPEKTEHSFVVDGKSTGAVEYQAPGESKATHWDEAVTVRTPTPGPVTMSVSWLSEADDADDESDDGDGKAKTHTKVVTAPPRDEPESSDTPVTTK